jgi:hypothetical protein
MGLVKGESAEAPIIVHIIGPSGQDHYPRFTSDNGARRFIEEMRKLNIPASTV